MNIIGNGELKAKISARNGHKSKIEVTSMNTNSFINNAYISNTSNISTITSTKPKTNTQQFIELYGKDLNQ